MTQPAVSIPAKKIAGSVELPLTQVVGRQLHITGFGKRNSRNSGALSFREWKNLNYKTTGFLQRHHDGKLRIACCFYRQVCDPFIFYRFFRKKKHGNKTWCWTVTKQTMVW